MDTQQGPNGPRQCANNCGFYGWPETHDMCSKCYAEYCKKQENNLTEIADDLRTKLKIGKSDTITEHPSVLDSVKSELEKDGDRCGCCKKRVRLMNRFSCRCGGLYCPKHRYPEEHECTFDFKMVGRELLVKANPLVRADKLERI